MLTFFRKIRKGLLGSGQARKYLFYAIGEVALVVIGILIALQINNWNEKQKTKEEEVVFLKRLKSEFESNQALILGEIRKQENISDGLRSLLQVISPKPVDTSIDSFQNYMTALSHVPKYTPKEGTITSMISSGKISLISNERLNVLLTQWPGLIDDYNYLQNVLYDVVKVLWYEYMSDKIPFRDNQIDLGLGSTGHSVFDYNRNRILTSMEVETIAELKRVDTDGVLIQLRALQEIQKEILQLILKELK